MARGKLKASCNQSRFPGVNRVSARLKISFPADERSHGAGEEPRSAPGWLTPRVAPREGLWPLRRFAASGMFLILVMKLRGTKKEGSGGCSGLCGEQPPAHSPQGWREHGRALPAPGAGGLGAGRVSQPSNKKRNSIGCYK